MKLLIAVTSVMMNVMGNQIHPHHTQCLPNGCFYDVEEDLTRQISCQSDGRRKVLYYRGNNGCDEPKYLLSKATYISAVQNPCCKPKPIPDIFEQPNEYCTNQYCDKNKECQSDWCSCFIEGRHEVCMDDGTLAASEAMCGGSCDVNSDCDKNAVCKSCVDNQCKNVLGELSEDELLDLAVFDDEAVEAEVTYTITIKNPSGLAQDLFIFQDNPIAGSGYPIVFSSMSIPNLGSGTFRWSIDWGLSWKAGSAQCTPLSNGIEYSINSPVTAVTPIANSENGASVTYKSNVFEMEGQSYSDIHNGQLEIRTDGSFTNVLAKSDCFSLCVTQSKQAIFAIDGYPNHNYKFSLTPTYWLAMGTTKVSTTVDASVISNPRKVVFQNGVIHIDCSISDNNEILC